MSTCAESLCLIAHVVNATSYEDARVEFEVATCVDEDWFTNSGWQVWPFWNIPLGALMHDTSTTFPDEYPARTLDTVPTIPNGWIEHLHELAAKHAAAHRFAEPKAMKPSFLQAMLRPKAVVNRRGL